MCTLHEARAFLFDLPPLRARQLGVEGVGEGKGEGEREGKGEGERVPERGGDGEGAFTGRGCGREGVCKGGDGRRVLAVELRADRFLRRMVRILVRVLSRVQVFLNE